MLMKTNNFLVLLFLVFCGCASDKMDDALLVSEYDLTISREGCFPTVGDKYVYPIVPGMIEWMYATNEEIMQFCQLPEDVLKSISTPGLIDALIHIPFFPSQSNISSDASALKWHYFYSLFNSAEELFQRTDAGDALVDYYRFVCLDCLVSDKRSEELKQRRPFEHYQIIVSQTLWGLECLFTKWEILNKMGHHQKKQAVAVILANYQYLKNDYSVFHLAYLMYSDKYEPVMEYARKHSNEFIPILNGFFYSKDQVDLFLSFAKQFIKN